MKNPYKVPPFAVDKNVTTAKTYYWWSWHPNYPYWSKSCWGGRTIEEAREVFNFLEAHSLSYYHNKLIQERDGCFYEVEDVPCKRLDVWQEIARDRNGWRKPTDAKPMRGWDK